MKILILSLLVLFSLSCTSAPAVRTIDKSFNYTASFDDVWSAVVETIADLSVVFDKMEKDTGIIISGWKNAKGQDDNCDCGGLGLTREFDRRRKYNIFVIANKDGGVTLTVNIYWQQTYGVANSTQIRECVSTGKLEKEIHTQVSIKLN